MKKTSLLLLAALWCVAAYCQTFDPKRHVRVTLEDGGPGFILCTLTMDTAYVPLELIYGGSLIVGIPDKGKTLWRTFDTRMDTARLHLAEFSKTDSLLSEEWMTKCAPVVTAGKDGLVNLAFKCRQPLKRKDRKNGAVQVSIGGMSFNEEKDPLPPSFKMRTVMGDSDAFDWVRHQVPLAEARRKTSYVLDAGFLVKSDQYLVLEKK